MNIHRPGVTNDSFFQIRASSSSRVNTRFGFESEQVKNLKFKCAQGNGKIGKRDAALQEVNFADHHKSILFLLRVRAVLVSRLPGSSR